MSDNFLWRLRRPLACYPGRGNSPYRSEDCGQPWIHGPFSQVLMHYCPRPGGDRENRGMVYTDGLWVGGGLDQLPSRKPIINLDDLRAVEPVHLPVAS